MSQLKNIIATYLYGVSELNLRQKYEDLDSRKQDAYCRQAYVLIPKLLSGFFRMSDGAVSKAVRSCIRETIRLHGPIDVCRSESLTKRIVGQLKTIHLLNAQQGKNKRGRILLGSRCPEREETCQ